MMTPRQERTHCDSPFGAKPGAPRALDPSRAFRYDSAMLPGSIATMPDSAPASMPASIDIEPLISDPAGVLAILLGVLAVIFYISQHPALGRIFKVIPALVFCYFVPTTLTTLGVIPAESELYTWVKAYVLPAALLLLVISLDIPAILRLGPKAGVMLLAGTVGVVIGGPISLLICEHMLPDDAWRGMTALAGSWIGGGANFVALGEIAHADSNMITLMVVPDVFVANIWMGILLYASAFQHKIDAATGADASAIRDLEKRLTNFQERVSRIPSLADMMMIVGLGFVAAVVCLKLSNELAALLASFDLPAYLTWLTAIGGSTWKYILITTLGMTLSFTAVRNLEGAGASKIGSVMLYLLIACIGASADFHKVVEAPAFVLMGFVWMSIHILVLIGTALLIRAPIFFVAVGSQANIGGAASAPVVAAAFHPSLAPVGVLLAVAGYVLGTYAGLVCMKLLMLVAGAQQV